MKRFKAISRIVVNKTKRKSIKLIAAFVLIACLLTTGLLHSPRVKAAGGVSFAPHNDLATGSSPESVATGDFNGDGNLDLVIANSSTNTVSILLGTGTGTFGAKTDFPTGNAPFSVAVGDFNGDGKLDLATGNVNDNTVSILLGTGTGSFGPKTDFSTGFLPFSIAVADFNGDGKLDLVTPDFLGNTVSILLGIGDGTFGAKTDFATGTQPFSVAVGDFNRDGKPDLAVAHNPGTVSILLGTGTGTFGAPTDFSTGDVPISVAVGDFNGDGNLDLVTTNETANTVSILLGTGTGTFGAKTDFATGSGPESVAVGDFNGDGKLDLAVGNAFDNTVSILLGTGTGSFGAKTDFSTGTFPISVAAGDFNNDGKLDLAAANRDDNTVSTLLNTTTFPASGAFFLGGNWVTHSDAISVAVGDFNRDGKLDTAAISSTNDSVLVSLGNGDGTFGVPVDYTTGSVPDSVIVGDFNGDGKLDLAVPNEFDDTVSILLGNGDGTFAPRVDYPTGSGPVVAAVGDFNHDGKLDLAVANSNDDTVSILLGNGDGTFQANQDFNTGFNPEGITTGDFDGDGNLDLAVANANGDTVSILLGGGDGSFSDNTDFSTGTFSDPFTIATADLNRDGKLDLVTANPLNNTVSVLLGVGDGTFQAHQDYATGNNPTWVVTGDFNSDGKQDLAVANSSDSTVSILNGIGDGTFAAKTDYFANAGPFALATGDFNRDGRIDLAVGDGFVNLVSILLNGAAAPDLAIVKSHSGNFLQGSTGNTYDILVTNAGQLPTDGTTVTVTDNLPAGLTATAIGGTGWTCGTTPVVGPGSISCTSADVVAAGDSYPDITVTVDVAGNAADLVNTATVAGGGDTNTFNNTSNDFTFITATTVYTDPAGVCGGNTPCFTSIQKAINAVADNGTVQVGGGQYLGTGGFEDVFENHPVIVNINGDITVEVWFMEDDNAVLNGLSATISISDEWEQDAGTFNAGTGTVKFIGGAFPGPQVICGTVETVFNNLTINNAGQGAVLDSNKSVIGVLTLTGSDLDTTSAFTLTMPNTASSTGTGDVIGSVKRTGFDTAALGTPLSFGNPFNTISIDSGTPPTDITVTLTKTAPDDAATGETNSGFPNAINRTYVINPNGGSGFSATLQLHYQPGDLNGNDENGLTLWRFNSSTGNWESKGAVARDLVNHSATAGGVTEFSPWTLNSTVVTSVKMENFHAVQHNGGALLQWQTGFEVNNLGFNVYRQQGGDRVKINPSLIAGSALMIGGSVRLESGNSYSWQDDVSDPTASYWLEDVDLNGKTEWHGPVGVDYSASSNGPMTNSALLDNLSDSAIRQTNAGFIREYVAGFDNNSSAPAVKGSTSAVSQPITAGRTPTKASSVSSTLQKQWQIAAQPAVKIAVNKTGWYHVNMTDILAAGLGANPNNLQMFVGGVEVPIKVNLDSVEFYGVGIDTAASDTQVYWLTAGLGSGKRINIQASPGATNNNGPTSFQYTVERKDRTVYFSSLRNGDAENWFGSVIATQPVTNVINVHNLDANAAGQAQLEIALQGVTTKNHQVTVMINGQAIQAIGFDGMDHKVAKFALPDGALINGDNQITFTTQSSGDVSLVDYIRVTYAHTYTADNNSLSTTAVGIRPIKVTGFTSDQITAIDVVNPTQPVQLNGTIDGDAGNYAISVDGSKRRNLLVLTADRMLRPLSITANQPSNLTTNAGGNFVVITHRDFAQSIQPLVALRQSQGYQVVVVDVEDIYDQFSYGVHSPNAVKEFLNWTYMHWPKQPQYVLLAGSATIDPRNYSGLGSLDFVPTKLIDTSNMETASDDSLVDFNNDGKPQMAIGRLPIRTAADADLVVNKIIAYEQSGAPEGVVLVSDLSDDGANFKASNDQIKALVPNQLNTISIVRGQTNVDAKTALMDQLTQGQRIINYAGHGSVDLWRGGLFSANDVQSLANHRPSPLVVTMTCLNGYFQDPHLASLGESLLRVKQGGAVAVWASTGMAGTTDQTTMNREFFKQLFGSTTITIGDAIKQAKSAVKDDDVRKTWILFGDPTMKIKQ